MKTMTCIEKTDPASETRAADCLAAGKIAILPTDTVYGFSGIVDFKEAEKKAKEDAKKEKQAASARNKTIKTIGNSVVGTVGREMGKSVGKKFGSFGKTLGGNVGASLGRGLLSTLFKK